MAGEKKGARESKLGERGSGKRIRRSANQMKDGNESSRRVLGARGRARELIRDQPLRRNDMDALVEEGRQEVQRGREREGGKGGRHSGREWKGMNGEGRQGRDTEGQRRKGGTGRYRTESNAERNSKEQVERAQEKHGKEEKDTHDQLRMRRDLAQLTGKTEARAGFCTSKQEGYRANAGTKEGQRASESGGANGMRDPRQGNGVQSKARRRRRSAVPPSSSIQLAHAHKHRRRAVGGKGKFTQG
ncbi:hypothetical protein FB451DRAFT_1175072 [Mycena latifolia]|nr:hypothetical protein FB451DRAFT_1175072 [Mycena latifolia]